MLGQRETIQEFQHRFPVLFYCILGFFSLIYVRLFYLQWVRGEFYRKFSESQYLREEKLPGPRGQIFDREGKVLVDNRLQLDVVITPQFAKNPPSVLLRLAELSGEPFEKLMNIYDKRSRGQPKFQAVTIIENAEWPLVAAVESTKEGLDGVEVRTRILRTYLQGKVGAHVYGYLNQIGKEELKSKPEYILGDWIGRSGLERMWEKNLRGIDGVRYVEVDAHGHQVRNEKGSEFLPLLHQNEEPLPGNDLVLTIDADLQMAAAQAMEGHLGGVAAIDPRTGEVLTMLSQPSYNPTDMAIMGGDLWMSFRNNPFGPLRNKTVQDHFPAGSTFKPFTALAALESNVIEPSTRISCPPTLRLGSRVFHDHKKEGFGVISVHEAIRGSSDVFFWQVALKTGVDPISKIGKEFGLGTKTGIMLPSEAPGLMPTEEWKLKARSEPWQAGDTLSAAIGQGYNLVTPLQLAVAYGTIANGGNVYKPYLVSRIQNNQGQIVKTFEPQLVRHRPIDPVHLKAVRDALWAVANEQGGTAVGRLKTKEGLISGKSGTVQVVSMTKEELFMDCKKMPIERRHHAWFVGYAPRENPEIVVSVFIMHGCGGSSAASPVVRAVVDKWWEKKQARERVIGPLPADKPQAR